MAQIPGDSTPEPVVLEEGRWTLQRPDETPREAEERLMRGEDIDSDKERLPAEVREMIDGLNTARPRFGRH